MNDYQARAEGRLAALAAQCESAYARVGLAQTNPAVPWAVAGELHGLKTAGLLGDFIDSVLAQALANHFQQYGWAIPLPCSLHQALDALVGGKTRLPDAYLQAVFPSFWHAGKGPAFRSQDADFWAAVLRYPCGLNDKGETYPEITSASLRKACRVQRKTVSWFSAARALRTYENHLDFEQEKVRIWDPSGGFGARMLAAAAWGKKHNAVVTYMACEPAPMTRADLHRLGAALGRLPDMNFVPHVFPCGSERFSRTDAFDLVFTSPPYFNTERYFDTPGQCWRDYPKREEWERRYLVPTAKTAKGVLRPGGRLVLNVKNDADAWTAAVGPGVRADVLAVKAGPFARSRGQTDLDEKLLIWEKP